MPIYAVLSTLFACTEKVQDNSPTTNNVIPAPVVQVQPVVSPLTEEDKKIIQALGIWIIDKETFVPNSRLANWLKPLARGDAALDHADFEALSNNPSPIAGSVREMFQTVREFNTNNRGGSPSYVLFSTTHDIFKKGNSSISSTPEHGIIGANFSKPLLTFLQMGLNALYPDSNLKYGSYDDNTAKVVKKFEQDNNITPENGNDIDRTTLSMLLINMDTPKEKLIADLNKMRDDMVNKNTSFLLDKDYANAARPVIRALQYLYPNKMTPYKGIVNNDVGRQLCDQANKVYGPVLGLSSGQTINVGPNVLKKLIEQLGGQITAPKASSPKTVAVAVAP